MGEAEKLRVDKYLWAIRVFKTRTLATDACKAGRVKLDGKQNSKASAIVKIGDVYHISKGAERKVIQVVDFSYNRTDAKIAVTKYKDLTPEEDTRAFKSAFSVPTLTRDRGTGRPTKKDRRETDDLLHSFWANDDDE